jgi:membrane-bound lytic murein transglycosylase D
MRLRRRLALFSFNAVCLLAGAPACAQTGSAADTPARSPTKDAGSSAPSPSSDAANASSAPTTNRATAPTSADLDELYAFGRQLFDDYAPEAVRDQYDFVSKEQWDVFAARLQASLAAGSVENLAALEDDARRTLAALRMMPAFSDYADWLAERLDLMETARIATRRPAPPRAPKPLPSVVGPTIPNPEGSADQPSPPAPSGPVITFAPPPRPPVPFYDIWLARLRDRPKPSHADELMPVLKLIFAAEGLPTELVWLAEVESSLNTHARSPAGARGLFQLMPATARAFGLRTFPFDERTQPGKNARAAAKLLRVLHDRFDSWPLALAAYNAGEGRVAIAQKRASATTYADIAELLPAETRMYVPKVLATLAVREKTVSAALRVPETPSSAAKPVPASFFPAVLAADP